MRPPIFIKLSLLALILSLFFVGCSDECPSPTGPQSSLTVFTPGDKAIPAGYYDSVDATNAATMRTTLHQVIDDHVKFPYTSTATDTWNILEDADEDPNDSGRILDVYRNASYPKYGEGNLDYNREHSWPSSYGFPNDLVSNYPYTDCHHLFLSNDSYNSARGNKPYRYCPSSCDEQPTEYNNGTGGGTGVYPGNSNWTSGFLTAGTWETWMGRRGDVARALLYMDVRYEGGTHGVTGHSEPDLILTDTEALIEASNTGSMESVAYMGMLSVLLEWHVQDPVDAVEMARNEAVYGYQGNRNPFIDHPEWVDCIFSDSCDGGGPVDPPSGEAWINEFHYDNDSTDTGEFVEIAGPAGLSLSGWAVHGYNGNGGTVYDSEALSGTIADMDNGYGVLSFAFVGLQNGSPDAIALVNNLGEVIDFISYEGDLTAVDGPAAGLTAPDIGVSEPTDSPVGFSLQLSGTGTTAAEFTWQAPSANTAGAINTGQSFGGTPPVNQDPTADANGPYAADVDVAISFSSAGSTDPDGTIVSYDWDFGDGNGSTAANPSHAYTSDGTFSVSLTVTDNDGATDTDVTSAVITAVTADPDMHVDAIAVTTVAVRRKDAGQATVTILDDQGQPVAGASVTGTFSGEINQTLSGTTGANGVVVITSTKTNKPYLDFTFCVDNVTASGYIYNAGANSVTCATH
jgi:endonuclease I/PKD repeat protein